MVCHWPLNLPPLASQQPEWIFLPTALTTGSIFSPPGYARRCLGTGRCEQRSTGAICSSRLLSNDCFALQDSFRIVSVFVASGRSLAASSYLKRDARYCLKNWLKNRWFRFTASAARCDIGYRNACERTRSRIYVKRENSTKRRTRIAAALVQMAPANRLAYRAETASREGGQNPFPQSPQTSGPAAEDHLAGVINQTSPLPRSWPRHLPSPPILQPTRHESASGAGHLP